MPQAVVAAQAFIYGVVGTSAAAVGFSSATAASIAAGAVGIATATAKVALLAGLNLVVANQNKPRPQGGMINLTINPDEPRRLQIGKRITGGVLTDWYVGGTKNGNLYMIVYLGEGPMGQITKVYGGGREVYSTPLVHGTRTEIPAYRSVGDRIPGRLWITYYDGRPGQTADSYLVGKSLGWTADHVGAGCAYAIIEAWWDSDNQTTPPSITFEIEGAKLYDRRKDSTAGGSGSHRADNPATWELSSNPAVALDHYLLGRYVGGIKTFGVGLEPEDVPYAPFAALANLCDEDVPRKVSGTLKRYEANGFLFADRTYADTIRDLCRAMNARPADFGGRIGIISGEEKTPVMTLADADVIDTVPEQYTPKRSWADLVSVVRGTYQNPAQLYQAGEYPRVEDAAWTEADGGSPKEATLDLEMETDVERAQRLARLFALRERRQAKLAGTYGLRTIELEQGDWFIRSGGIFGAGKTFEVIDRVLDPRSMTVTLTAFEVDPADSAWDEDDAVDPPPDPISSEDELLEMEVPVLTVTGVTLSGTAAELPAIKVEWEEPEDIRVQQIVIEAVPEAGGVPTSAQVDWATGQVVFTSGITDDTDYLVRARFIGDFIPSEWTDTYEVTTLGDYSVGVASSVPWSGVTGTGRPADNATVGARAGTNLYRTDGTTVMTQPEVRTSEGTAAAITGQGALATRSTALASMFDVADPSNMITDADFRDSAAWTAPSGWTFGSTDSDVTTGLGLARAWKTVAGNGATSQAGSFAGFPASAVRMVCEVGRPLRLAVRALVKSGFNGQINLQVRYGTASGTQVALTNLATADYRTSPAGSDTVVNLSAVSVPPANSVYVQYRVNLVWPTASNSAGHAYIGAPFMQRAAQLGSLVTLEDGSTLGTDALLRTSLGTAAAITGQGPGATAAAAAVLNENIATRGLLSARPASGVFTGQLYYATDTGQQFEWTGSAWALRADITAQSQLTISATTTNVVINCDSAGVPITGQLPRTVGLVLKLGNTVVSADAAWAIVSSGAATATVDDTATAAAGNLTVTALPANSDIVVSATYGGVTLRQTVSFARSIAPPPVGGSSGGTSASDTSVVDPGSTSYTVVTDTLTITTGSGGNARLVANIGYEHGGIANQNLVGRWQRDISGSWTDVGTEITGTNSNTVTDPESGAPIGTSGVLDIDQTITGLGASTSQSFRLRTKRSGGTVWSVYGTATATGS